MAPISEPKTKFSHLFCDLDGTLIDSGGIGVQAEFIGRTLPVLKKHQGWRAAYLALKEGQDALKKPSKTETNFERMLTVFQKRLKLSRDDAEKEMRSWLDQVFPKLENHFGEIKGAAKFLEWAKTKYGLTLTTNPVWPIDLVHMRMRWGGIDPTYFKSVTTVERMHSCKPTADYYLEVLNQEMLDAEKVLLIGNERTMDLPATKVGIAVFLIRVDAKSLSCIQAPTEKNPGAWRGNYTHLKKWLLENDSE